MPTIDVDDVTRLVNQILIEQLGVTENQLTREANLVRDLGAEVEELDDIYFAIGQTFNIPDFHEVESHGDTVGELIDAVVDVRQQSPAGPGR